MKIKLPASLAGLLLTIMLGCDNGRVAVKGKVTCDGIPVKTGSINFEPMDGIGNSAGGAIENGEYYLELKRGVLPGKKLVHITAIQITGKKVSAGPPFPPGVMVDDVRTLNPPVKQVEVMAGEVNRISLNF